MTTRREVPIAADTLAWVHNELAEIKSRLALIHEAAEQSRAVASDASEKAQQTRVKVDQFDAMPPALSHLQDDLHAVREQVARAQDDIHSLRQSRDEIERYSLNDAERARQDRNEAAHRFAELERQIAGWQERVTSFEEHNRRNLEIGAHLMQRLETIENELQEDETLRSRSITTLSRIDNEIQRLAGAIPALQREDDVQHERHNTAFEVLRRLETDIEALRTETNRITRLDDRLELVQAERTRHNERLNELSAEMAKIDGRLNEQGERLALIEVKMAGQQEDLRKLRGRLQADRDQLSGYLHSLSELEADIRKRQIIALEKEIRDVRGRALNFTEE